MKQAWLAARVPYQQSEVFRFGNAIVDDWEGQLNAWPLDEGLIDYVAGSYQHELGNEGANANIIANTALTIGATKVDVKEITPELLASLNEIGGSEANVASGYHAIEFRCGTRFKRHQSLCLRSLIHGLSARQSLYQ